MIKTQHIANELVFYAICACLVSFCSITDLYQSILLGWLLIVLICYLIIYNLVVVAYDMLSYLKLLLIRYNRSLPSRLGNFVLRNKDNGCFCIYKRKKQLTKRQKQKIMRKITPYMYQESKKMSYEVRFEKQVDAVLRDVNNIKIEDFLDIDD